MNNSNRLSKRINLFKNEPSPIKAIMNYGDPQYIQKSGINPDELISFAGGWSNHAAPENLRRAYENILADPERFHFSGNYSTSIGDKEFRNALCKFENYLYGMDINEKQIAVGLGSTQLTNDLFSVLLDPEDKVVLLDPSYSNYPEQLSHGNVVASVLRFSVIDEDEWKYVADQKTEEFCKYILKNKPKIVLLISPDNPTSKILSQEFVQAVLDSVKKIDGYLIIDFAYKELVYEDKLPSYFSWSPNENFILLRSNSKWCRGLGRRLGWIEAPKFVINAMESIQSSTILCPDTLHQMALTKFINDSIENNMLTDYISDTKKMYKHAAKKTVDLIKQNLKFKIIEPDGGLYIFMKVDTDGQEFVQEMLKKTGVLFIPGWGFGNTGKNAVRISFGPLVNDLSKIEDGIIKISKILKQNN